MIETTRACLGDAVEVLGAGTGMHLVVRLPRAVDDVALSNDLADIGISAVLLSTCFLEPAEASGLIPGYGNADPQQINVRMAQLAAVLRRKYGLATAA
ncbi:MAG: hypothetical protein ACREPF_10320 [Rhodanobacteraceae bacterium]